MRHCRRQWRDVCGSAEHTEPMAGKPGTRSAPILSVAGRQRKDRMDYINDKSREDRVWALRSRKKRATQLTASTTLRPSRSATATRERSPQRRSLAIRLSASRQQDEAVIAASRTPPWLLSGWGCLGRRLSRG